MLTTARSVNVGFSQVVQLLAAPTNPAYAPRTENSFYKFRKKFFWVSTMCAQILGFSRVRVRVRVSIRVSLVNWFVLVLWTITWRHLLNQCLYGRKIANY